MKLHKITFKKILIGMILSLIIFKAYQSGYQITEKRLSTQKSKNT